MAREFEPTRTSTPESVNAESSDLSPTNVLDIVPRLADAQLSEESEDPSAPFWVAKISLSDRGADLHPAIGQRVLDHLEGRAVFSPTADRFRFSTPIAATNRDEALAAMNNRLIPALLDDLGLSPHVVASQDVELVEPLSFDSLDEIQGRRLRRVDLPAD